VAATIREFLVAIGVRADNRALTRFDRNLGRVKAGMTTIVSGALFATAAVASTTVALVGMAQATALAGDEAAKMGKRVGLTAGEVQGLGFAAELAGAGAAEVELGLRRLSKTARDAQRGLASAGEAFDDLGVSVEDDQGQLKPTLDLFLETAEAISQLENDTTAAAIAQDVFGRGGAKLVPLLREGRDAIEAYMREAEELGFVFDEEAAVASENFIDAQLRARKVLEGVRNTIGLAVIPALTTMIDKFTSWWKANREIIQQRLEQVADTIADSFDRLGQVMLRADQIVRTKLGGWERVFQGIGAAVATLAGVKFLAGLITVLSGLVSLISIVGGAIAGIGLGTLGLVLLAIIALVFELALALSPLVAWIVAIGLVIEDLIVWLRGGESAFGAFLSIAESGRRLLPTLVSAWESLARVVRAVGGLFSEVARIMGILLLPLWEALRSAVMAVLAPLYELAIVMLDTLLGPVLDRLELWIFSFDTIAEAIERMTAALRLFTGEAQTAGEVIEGLERFGRFVLRGGIGQGPEVAGPTEGARRAMGVGGFAPAGVQSGVAGAVQTVNIEGDSVVIEGSDLSPAELARIMDERDQDKRRQAAAALAGGDV